MTEFDDDHLVCAYSIDKNGQGAVLELEEIPAVIQGNKGLVWVHLDAHHDDTRDWMAAHMPFLDALTIDALLDPETRPRIVENKDSALVILRGVNLYDDAQPEDMVSIRIWMNARYIVSTRQRRLKAVEDIRERLENGTGPKDSGEFLSALCSRLFQRMEPTIMDLDQDTDAVEEVILEQPDISVRHTLVNIRKRAIGLRRYIAPQKEVLSTLRISDLPWLDVHHRRHMQENYDRVLRYVEELDAVRERAQIVKDELANILADRMNKNMYVLSIVAAIFLPLGFLTGLLGINVGGMPGADSDIAFWLVCVLCGVFAAGILALFRFMKWL